MYREGEGVKKDHAEAAKWYRKAAEQGDSQSQLELGTMHYFGEGIKKNYAQAAKWYRKLAEQGVSGAFKYALGIMYYNGEGVEQDYAEAAKWFREEAEDGYARAQFMLGSMYFYGEGIEKDSTEAEKWYRKASKQDNYQAQYMMGTLYALGSGVEKNYAAAVNWWRKAANSGNARAQYDLGGMYALGKGVEKDETLAAQWKQKARAQGYQGKKSITNTIRIGDSIQLAWSGDAKAQFELGVSLLPSATAKKPEDYIRGNEWVRKSAEQGYAPAQSLLGATYLEGKGVDKDYDKGIQWHRKAADQEYAVSQYTLGYMYYYGQEGVKKDSTEAEKWWRRAANQGYAEAQHGLGVMYANGEGVSKSGAAAADWFYKAGLSYLKNKDKDSALLCVERIKGLSSKLHLTVPNAFLADKLLAQIYDGERKFIGGKKEASKHNSSFGTGWPVQGGYVVTNHHVVAGHNKIELMRSDGVKISGTIAINDAINDLVLIRVDDVNKLPPALPLASKATHAGAHVFTIGYPHPDFMGSEAKITDGLVSAVTGMGNDPRVYQISVPIQSGNSGGPLLNMKGEVVGITASKMRAAKVFNWTGDLPQNVNYAIKAGYLSMLLSSLPSKHDIPELSAQAGTIEQLAGRIKNSVLLVIAE